MAKKTVVLDARKAAQIRLQTDELESFERTIEKVNKRRIKTKATKVYESRVFRLMMIQFSKNPAKALEFVKYDDNN